MAVYPVTDYVTCTRANLFTNTSISGYGRNSAGTWTGFGANTLRYDYSGGVRRLLVEESRTNSIRNNSMQGASVKTTPTELVTNGDFALNPIAGAALTTLNGWQWDKNGGSGTLSWDGSTVSMTGDNVNSLNLMQPIATTVGVTYTISLDVSVNTVTLWAGNSAQSNTLLNATGIGPGTGLRYQFTATATTTWITISKFLNNTSTIDNVSVKAEMVVNGMFILDPINASQNTVQNGWQWSVAGGTTTVTYGSGAVTITADGTNEGRFGTSLATVAGRTYTVTCDVTGASGTIKAGTTFNTAAMANLATGTGTGLKFQFTATGTTTWITFVKTVAGAMTIDNVFVEDAGALPSSGWFTFSALAGIVCSVDAVTTTSGIDVLRLRLQGTPSGAGTYQIGFDFTTTTTANSGETWTGSVFHALNAGSLTGVSSIQLLLNEYQSGGTFVKSNPTTVTSPTGSSIGSQRQTATSTLSGGVGTARIGLLYQLTLSGAAIDLTIDIGWPQLELGAFMTSPIRTENAAVIRSADVVAISSALFPTNLQGLSAYTLYGKGMPSAPTSFGTAQAIVQIDAGADTNRHLLRRSASTGGLLGATVSTAGGGNGSNLTPTGTWAQDTSKKFAMAVTTNDGAAVFDNGTAVTDNTIDMPASIANLRVGSSSVPSGFWNGGIEQIAIWGSRRSNGALGTITT